MKKSKILFPGLILIILIISACTPSQPTSTPTYTPSPSQQTTPQAPVVNPVTATLTTTTQTTQIPLAEIPEKSDSMDITYKIDAQLDYSTKTVEVNQVIAIINFPLNQPAIELVVEPNRYPHGFVLEELRSNQIEITNFELVNHRLKFAAPEIRNFDEPVVIQLQYSINLPAIPPPSEMYKPQPYGYTDRQLNLVDWYPFVPPLDADNNWIIHPTAIFGESLVYPSADFSANLTLTGNSVPLVVAASGIIERAENTYYFSNPMARSFAISMSPDYVVNEGTAMGVSIKAYAFRDSENQNQVVLNHAMEALELFYELYGPLPQKTVSIVQADFLDGMEFDGLYFVSKGFYNLYDGTVKGYLTLITVHEMAHQWWFSAVGSDQAFAPWLDEGLSTFAELQYIEHYYPDLTDWWWGYRVNFYQPEGYINRSIYDYESYLVYRNAVYLQSAKFLYDLREVVSHPTFNSAIKEYYEENYLKTSDANAFFKVFSNAAGYPFAEMRAKYFVQD